MPTQRFLHRCTLLKRIEANTLTQTFVTLFLGCFSDQHIHIPSQQRKNAEKRTKAMKIPCYISLLLHVTRTGGKNGKHGVVDNEWKIVMNFQHTHTHMVEFSDEKILSLRKFNWKL